MSSKMVVNQNSNDEILYLTEFPALLAWIRLNYT